MKIINQIYNDEENLYINKINYKLLNENMRIFPYQNLRFRKKFLSYLFGDDELTNIFSSKETKIINDFITEDS